MTTQKPLFSSQLELANSVLTSDVLQQALNAIEKHPQAQFWHIETGLPDSNGTIISFRAPTTCYQLKQGLISSSSNSTLKKFEFLCNIKTPSFSVMEAAVNLFQQHYDELDNLKTELVTLSSSKPPPSILITGQSLGGCVAMLFTFWLLKSLNLSKAIRPLCITFGSPFLGDEQLQNCVLKFSAWKYCFLNVASTQDPRPQFFQASSGGSIIYKPFGTFLLCSASGCSSSEDPDLIVEQLFSHNPQIQDFDSLFKYGQILEALKTKALKTNDFVSIEGDMSSLQACIMTQLLGIGVLLPQQQPSTEIRLLIRRMIGKTNQKKDPSGPDRKLNEMKIAMANLERYKLVSKLDRNIGYYDLYKAQMEQRDIDVNNFKTKLSNYWEDKVAEVENKPQIEGEAFLRTRWLFGGTNYRRMVEPLHIADYYKDGKKDYINGGKRPRHFVLLEQWQKDVEKPEANLIAKRKNVKASLNEDSCFWAHVEEALISCNLLKTGSSITSSYTQTDVISKKKKQTHEEKLKEFEVYVYDALKNYALSPEIFLGDSSFMQWWKDYQKIMEDADLHGSLLGQFMVNGDYLQYGNNEYLVLI